MSDPLKNPNAWAPIAPRLFSQKGARNPEVYRQVVAQFGVETNPRYIAGHDNNPNNGLETYCNIFLWDVSVAMGCEIPHWIDPATLVGVAMGKGRETDANGVCDWLAVHSLLEGWMICGVMQARTRASAGYPTCVAWKNPGSIGHVAVVMPGMDYTHISQSGGSNFYDKNLIYGFGNVRPLAFYTHD